MLHYFFKLEAIIKTVTRIPVNFDLRSLQIFAVAAERGGMTQCARALDMTQSGVSQTIAKLEEIVGSDLFDRTKRPIGLTLAGRALLLRAHKILDDVQNAYVETAQSGQSRKIGTLTIAMPDSVASAIGPALYGRKKAICDNWHIMSGLTPFQREEFLSHAIDMIVTDESNISNVTGLQRFGLMTEPYILIFPKNYQGPQELGPHLLTLPLVRFTSLSAAGYQIEAQLDRLSVKYPKRIEVDTPSCQLATVVNGHGWGITTPLCLLQRPTLIDDLIVAPITKGSFGRHLYLVARQNALGDIPKMFADEFKKIVNEEIIPDLTEKLPWLEGKIKILTDDH
ncbi:MAG: LysR family transcriptional regulator [Robiginitomaculum sp.]|nr:LysR family transcriptional regulator [Robiginitomaculum sp.]